MDLISRQTAIDAICSVCGADNECDKSKFVYDAPKGEQVIMCPDHYVLTHLPSEGQQWTPVSEGLPEDLKAVNVTWINREPEKYYEFIKDVPMVDTAVFFKGRWFWWTAYCIDVLGEYGCDEADEIDDRIEVIAWQPLPEPYKGGDAE